MTRYLVFVVFFMGLFLSDLAAETLRILPFGDSITYDNNHHDDEVKARPIGDRIGYRGPLWSKLKAVNKDFDFVGTRKAGQNYAPDFDPDNDGYPGETSYELAGRTYGILTKTNPNVILLHAGTNDNSSSIKGINQILDWIDTYENDTNQEIRVIVALIIDRTIPDKDIEGFNQNLVKLIIKRREQGDILTMVDMYRGAGFNNSDYADVTHPNSKGYEKMAQAWFETISTPYEPYSSAPITKDDKINAQTGQTVSINVTSNDIDYQGDMDRSSVNFIGGKDTDNDGDNDKLVVADQGTWIVDSKGIVIFTPNHNFTADPHPIQYTIKDAKGQVSKPATITIIYANASLENYPTSLVDASYIESISINKASNSVEFITRVPDAGITF